jgi:uncharacterized damage-inducible protein DinB
MQRGDVLKHWNDAWKDGLWAAPWGKMLNDLTPQQAAWVPTSIDGATRHSIWQIVNHMIFWREHDLRTFKGDKPSPEEKKNRNFEPTPEPTAANWETTKQHFAKTQSEIAAAIANQANPTDRLQYHLFHDSYHIGQIMYLRALQGLKPIE